MTAHPAKPKKGGEVSQQAAVALRAIRAGSDPTVLPAAMIGNDVIKANGYSRTIAVKVGPDNSSFAVAPVVNTVGPSAVPALLAAALIAALAGLGGALVRQRRSHGTLTPATAGGTPAGAVRPASPPARAEAVTSRELRLLRRDAQQKADLARSLAELLPGLPEALVWQAEQALTDAGVRPIVPDGEPFDAAVHYAVGTEPVPTGGRENTIARTIRPGYAADDMILVYPKVVVYANDAGRGSS